MSSQLSPSASQRCHWYSKSIGAVPLQVPVSAVSVSPSSTSPVIAGRVVSCGAAGTISGAADGGRGLEPPSLLAVTTTVIMWPTSSGPGV